MYVKVKVRFNSGETITTKVDLPPDIRDYREDTIDDAVSDYLQERDLDVKWFRVYHSGIINE